MSIVTKVTDTDWQFYRTVSYVDSSAADLGSGAYLTPGSGMGKNQDPDPG
jgi:hypothetical protein